MWWSVILFFAIIIAIIFFLVFGIIQIVKYKKTKEKRYLISAVFLSLPSILIILSIVAIINGGFVGERVADFLYSHNYGDYDCENNYRFTLYPTQIDCFGPEECFATEIVATSVTNSTPTDFSVTLTRTAGDDAIAGVKLVFANATYTVNVVRDIPGEISNDKTISVTIPPSELPNPNKVSVFVYFLDEKGREELCQTTGELKF